MRKVFKAAVSFVLYIAFFIIAPMAALNFLPSNVILKLRFMMGINPRSFIQGFFPIDITLACSSLFKNLTEERSPHNLLASLISAVVWFIFSLYMFGLGDPWSFGVIERSIAMGEATLYMNFRFILIILALSTVLNIVNDFLGFHIARKTG